MKSRLVAALLAGLLAVVGGVLLIGYVSRADDRAMAGMATQTVLVVTAPLPEGATSEELARSVEPRRLPAVAVAPGSATSLEQLEDRVTTTALQPGEQLLTSRLVDPATAAATQGVVVPPGLQKVSVQLEGQRVVGGEVAAGDLVGVFVSAKDDNRNYTRLVLQKVLVLAVRGGAASSGDDDGAGDPSSTTVVTLAVDAAGAQQVVFGAEHGSVWLSAESDDTPTSRLPVLTQKEMFS